jgi:hypothetical protein
MDVQIEYLGAVQFEIRMRQPVIVSDQPLERGGNPVRLDGFLIQVESPVPLNEEQKLEVEKAVQHCLIHNTLVHPPHMQIEVHTVAGVQTGWR